jgi:diaminopimelate decarboxylase
LVGGCLVSEIARQYGTPAYVVDETALRSRARDYLEAFTSRHPRSRICFAVKAYPSASIIRVLAQEGLGCDVVGADLVGRHCESGDVITPDVMLANPQVGDLIVVPVTGAYCFTMANNYNAALRPPVILCSNGTARLAVRRETYEDLMAREIG